MEVSIIIPTMDKISRLSLILKALENQVIGNVEVVVVFDGCKQSTLDAYGKLKLTYNPKIVIHKENKGRSAARNSGIREASGEILIFLDDDRIPGRDFIRMHADAHKNGEHVVLGNRKDVDLPEEIISEMIISGEFYDKLRSDAKEEKLLFKYRSPNNFFRWIYFYTGNLSVRKKHLKATGLFDENMKKWGHEDVDLGIRFFFEGIPFITRNDIVNYHILHENSLTERGESSLASLRYLKKKYRAHPLVFTGLSLMYFKCKYFD